MCTYRPVTYRPELEVHAGGLVVKVDHLYHVPLSVAVEASIVGDDGLVQAADLEHRGPVHTVYLKH